MATLLAPSHVEQFRHQGWCALSQLLLPREVAALQGEVARLVRDGRLRNVRTDADGKSHSATQANLQLIPLHDKSDLLRALPFESRVVESVSRLIGDPFLLHLDQMFLKPGRVGTGTHWHQDNAYFKIADPLKGTAMWLAVHDATRANGTLRLIPGSHREPYPHERDPFSDHHIHCRVPERRAVAVEVPAGGAVFFCYGVAHCTGDNPTAADRAGIAFHFLHADGAAADLVAPDRDRRPWITGPLASGGRCEYGVDVRGTFSAQVERILAPAA